jgi:hypothetical protein
MDSPIGGILTGRSGIGGGRRESFLLSLYLLSPAMADERQRGKSKRVRG